MSEKFFPWYKNRGLLMVPIILVMIFCRWNEFDNKLIAYSIGSIFFLVGLSLRVWAQMHLHYRLKHKKILTTTGPYRYVRNPIYIGNTLLISGICFMTELFWLVPIVIVYCVVVYSFVIRYEEFYIENKYGDPYREYMGNVPRWIPFFRPVISPETSLSHSNGLSLFIPSIKAEYQCLFLIMIPIFKEILERILI